MVTHVLKISIIRQNFYAYPASHQSGKNETEIKKKKKKNWMKH